MSYDFLGLFLKSKPKSKIQNPAILHVYLKPILRSSPNSAVGLFSGACVYVIGHPTNAILAPRCRIMGLSLYATESLLPNMFFRSCSSTDQWGLGK